MWPGRERLSHSEGVNHGDLEFHMSPPFQLWGFLPPPLPRGTVMALPWPLIPRDVLPHSLSFGALMPCWAPPWGSFSKTTLLSAAPWCGHRLSQPTSAREVFGRDSDTKFHGDVKPGVPEPWSATPPSHSFGSLSLARSPFLPERSMVTFGVISLFSSAPSHFSLSRSSLPPAPLASTAHATDVWS